MREEHSERKSMSEEERKMMEEQEKTAEVWVEEKEERHEKASADLLRENEKGETIINPPSAGGKVLKGSRGETAAGAKCGYPSKPCNR